jgi:thymidylate kinase
MQSVCESPEPLQAVATLFQLLNQEGVRYCQWKSTHGLARALAGHTDFDLLVDRSHSRRFKEILYQCDFKPFVSHPSRQFPAIEDYLGFDEASGRLIHLHIHYRVVLGEEHVKNYYLPLETDLLNQTRYQWDIKVPAPELEVMVLAQRALLKYRDRDALRDILGFGRTGGLPQPVLGEFDYLLAQTSIDRVARALERQACWISPGVILEFLATIREAPRAGWRLLRLRRRVRRALAPYQRHSRLRAGVANFWIELTKQWPFDRVLRRLMPGRDKHKTPVAGGLMVAFIGADGAGKSTIIKHIVKWLSWRLVVRTYYMGSSQPSIRTRVWKGAADLAQIAHAGCRRVFGERNAVTRLVEAPRRLFENLRCLGDAHDRHRRYRAARRRAAQGSIVIFDRYPLEAVRIFNRSIDGPRIAARNNGHMGWLAQRLAAAEERIYRDIPPPEHVFVLHVSPDVSQARKPEHKRELIEAKSLAIKQISGAEFDLTDINADRPLEDILIQIKSTLWRLL